VPVLQNVCVIGEAGEATDQFKPAAEAADVVAVAAAPVAVTASAPVAMPSVDIPKPPTGISPRARNLAVTQHVDTARAVPTGPHGRIIERDIRAVIEAGGGTYTSAAYAYGGAIGGKISTADFADVSSAAPAASPAAENEYEDIAFSGIRRAISKSMALSLSTIPQLTHNHSFDASDILSYRGKIKSEGEKTGLPDISLGDMILFAVSRVLSEFPDLNAHMPDSNTLRRFSSIHLGFACDTPRGLLVPVIKSADTLSLAEISAEVKRLAAAARDGSLLPGDMSGGTFTVSNLGSFGVESFTPVINPPQTGILGVDCITRRPRMENGEIKLYPAMGLSLTYDHRAVDGAPAARFVSRLCAVLESFTLLLAR
ncbi:MAG: 2-oxo acid dehydrogenase subunit E2, partial [Oscillospiraceae bacterium]|nr:2-oxo acid dehydrogenase subunit E2 [Oscillospiraceae bacterium]